MEVRCAMKENEGYDDEEYQNDMEYQNQNRSYSNRYYNGGNMGMNGRGNSYARGGYNRTSGRRYNSYMNNGYSNRRSFDGEKENSINDLRQMLQMEQDPEKRSMMEGIMHVLENDK